MPAPQEKMSTAAEPTIAQSEFPCSDCGALLAFAPGTESLRCKHCGTENRIAADSEPIVEHDYTAALASAAADEPLHETLVVKCSACGAETSLAPNVTAQWCPFCSAAIVAEALSRKLIRPHYVLPFHVTAQLASSSFRKWIVSRWFAPSTLRQHAEARRLDGMYLPAWTYDCGTDSAYTGQRGDDYWVTESYYDSSQKTMKTRQVRRTRWTCVSGRVQVPFDDLLVRASESLPEKHFHQLEPWDLKNLVGYQDEYLAGFTCESYQVDVAAGFEHACQDMQGRIHGAICADIGGDHQRVQSVSTRYFDITYKHVLLPAWLSTYSYRDRTYRFTVNARTGEVYGERPYSFWKIAFAVLAAAGAVTAGIMIAQQYGHIS